MTEALFAEFDAATYDDWVEAARASLRGQSLESLVARSYEGIDIEPLPHVDSIGERGTPDGLPGQYPYLRGTTAGGYRAQPWLIANEIDLADPREFNAALREALSSGQTAIVLHDSLQVASARDMRRALAGINLRTYPLFIRGDGRKPIIRYRFLQSALSEDIIRQLSGYAGYDPLASLARTGAMRADAFERLADFVEDAGKYALQMGSVLVDTSAYHEAGANAAQELAIALATGVDYLRAAGAGRLSAALTAGKLRFQLGIGENFFMEIAKFRAIKSLWAQALRAFGVSPQNRRLRLHARGGLRNKTRRDRHVNLLRLTSEALAAAMGGVDSISLPAFDAALGTSDAFSRRLSRNLQLILKEEMQLTRLIDPAGGAWHIETLTDRLARKAWTRFQDIEAQGGMLAALRSGAIQAEIAAIAQQRKHDLASGSKILVGANAYVNEAETLPAARKSPAPDSAAAGADVIRVNPLQPLRLAEAFEKPQSATGAGA